MECKFQRKEERKLLFIYLLNWSSFCTHDMQWLAELHLEAAPGHAIGTEFKLTTHKSEVISVMLLSQCIALNMLSC